MRTIPHLLTVLALLAALGPGGHVYLPLIRVEPLPTATPTVTPTPRPTPTSTPSPTPDPGTVRVLSNHSAYVDSIDNLHILGEVRNTTPYHVSSVQITASFYDIDGHLLGSAWTYTHLLNVPSGARACFEIWADLPAGLYRYEFTAVDYWPDGDPLPDLTVLNEAGAYNAIPQWYEITGDIRNDHDRRVEGIMPVGTVYDGQGTVIGCDWDFIMGLDPGQTSPFEIIVWGQGLSAAASYRLQIDGHSD